MALKLKFGNAGFCKDGKTGVCREKLGTENKLNPNIACAGNQTQATLVQGKCFHHCPIFTPPLPTPYDMVEFALCSCVLGQA